MTDESPFPARRGSKSREPSPARAGKTVVLKFGTSSLLSDDGCKPKLSNIAKLVEMAVRLREAGHSVVIVSSGAVGTGCARMKLKSRPDTIAKKQAMASIGQLHLMRIYDEFFTTLGHTCSQVGFGVAVPPNVLEHLYAMHLHGGNAYWGQTLGW